MSAPAVAVSKDGKTFAAAWMDQRTGKEQRDAHWSVAQGGDFREESPLHEEREGIQDHPSVVFDEDGTAWAAWEDGRAGRKLVRVRSASASASASSSASLPEKEISTPEEGAAGFPVLASGGGLVGVVYEVKRDGGTSAIFRLIQDRPRR